MTTRHALAFTAPLALLVVLSAGQRAYAEQPTRFTFTPTFHDPDPGKREWEKRGNGYVETLPSGRVNTFRVQKTGVVNGLRGTIIQKVSEPNFFVFIADSFSDNKNWILSSQPRFPAERFATIPPNDAPRAPINAATEPPPGAGESLSVSLQNCRRFIVNSDFFFDSASIFSSITFSSGLKGFNSLNPSERTAIAINSSSDAPSDHCCFRRKYRPASTRHFFGNIPTISDPVTRKPRLLADSTEASNAAWSGVSSMLVKLIDT